MTINSAAILTELISFVPKVIAAVVIFLSSLIASNLAARWSAKMLATHLAQSQAAKPLSRLLRTLILIMGVIASLDQVDFDVSAFLAGMGIVGLTVGFALQNITENFVSGLLLMTRRPFDIGDAVTVSDYSGQIVDIRMRDTTIRTWDGVEVILPNTSILKAAITNHSHAARRRRTIEVGIACDQDIALAKQVFAKALADVPGVLSDPAPAVHASAFAESTITLVMHFWIVPAETNLLQAHSGAIAAVQQSAATHGIELPYPTQVVQLTK